MSGRAKDLGAILSHGKSLDTKGASKQIDERLDALELVIEQAGQNAKLVTSLNSYVDELRDDLRALRTTRVALVVLTVCFIILTNGSIIHMLYDQSSWFWLQEAYFKAAVVVGNLTSSVVLLSIMLKGAFHSLSERNKEDLVPPNVKEILEAVQTLSPK